MMEQSNSLLLNEEALRQCEDPKKPIFIYEWLRFLDKILPVTQKADIKNCQQKLVEQLMQRISTGPGPPTRTLLAKCIAKVFTITDSYDLFQTINICNDILKAKDDSNAQIQVKLAALAVLGSMYESLGKAVGRSYEESFTLMSKWIKSAESGSRTEILLTLSKMIGGLGPAVFSIHKDLYKLISKYLTDRVMSVRVAAIKCLANLVADLESPMYSGDLDALLTLAVKSLDGSNHEVRFEAAKIFANVAVSTMKAKPPPGANQQTTKTMSLDDTLAFMSTAFLRGGIGGFLKTQIGANYGGHRDIRVGIALAYIEVARELTSKWLERNLFSWQKHLLELANKTGPLFYTNNPAQTAEAVHMRRCISYVFRQTLGRMLSEHAQIAACKNFGQLINEYSAYLEIAAAEEEERTQNADGHAIASVCTVSLLEIAALVRQVDSSVSPLIVEASGIMDPIFSCITHPFASCRLSAAWCLRCVTRAVPTQGAQLIDRCLNRLEHLRKSSVTVSGFSAVLAALTAGSLHTELGIPFQRSRQVFCVAEDLIKTAAQSSKLALSKTQAGWLLATSVISMGSAFVRPNLSRLLMLWKCSFPRSVEEAKAEKDRGDVFTWQCTIESRAGALGSMEAFVIHCPELVTSDVMKRIIRPVESTLATMALVADLLNTHGAQIRNPIHLLRIRLYALIQRLPFKEFESVFNSLLRELVADITLSDNAQSTLSSSQLASQCSAVEECLLSGWLKNSTHSELELQLNSSQCAASGALEFDPLSVVMGASSWNEFQSLDEDDPSWPQPLPPQLASLDAAIRIFGRIYPLVPTKHKLQLTNHFLNCLMNIKPGNRQQAIQMNILGAILCAMRSMGAYRNAKIESPELQEITVRLVKQFIISEKPLLRCLAAEAWGRLAQTVAEPQFVAGSAQSCFDDVRSMRDEKSRAGLALTLGCLHRYVGSLGSGQHLNTAVGIVLSLAQDMVSPTVQSWALLSLSLIATTGAGMFDGYVMPSLELCLRQLLNTPPTNTDVIQCIGKLVSSLITVVGPELPSTVEKMENMRASFIVCCSMMLEHSDPQIRAEAIACYQQLHLFAPRFVQLDRLVANICHLLYSPHLVLRRSAINCLKQLLQRETKEVREHAQNLVPAGIMEQSKIRECPLPETGLEGALFELLDLETDADQRQKIKECLLFLVQATSGEMLNFWLSICKDILASTANTENIRSTLIIEETKPTAVANTSALSSATEKSTGDAPDDDDEDTLQTIQLGETKTRDKVAPRWPTRVFAFTIVQKLMTVCETERAHLDLALAKELQMSSNGRADYLVLHLADLVRMSFMGATSENWDLRLAGLTCLQDVIDRFAAVPEPEFPGHVVLEQFQAQVGAALRPAFEPETPSHVTAAACQVCSAWIGSGVARDLNDLRRVHQLLVSSLGRLKSGAANAQLYNESASTLEKLSILKAWAEVYVVAVKREEERRTDNSEGSAESLLSLVNPELDSLLGHWMGALRDSAMLSLPPEFADQLPDEGGVFYTPDSADSSREYYRNCWPPIILASSIWLKNQNFALQPADSPPLPLQWTDEERISQFHAMLGMCVESLCASHRQFIDNDSTVHLSLETLTNLIDCQWAQTQFMSDIRLPIEVMNVLHRLILTKDNLQIQKHCTDVVESVLNAATKAIAAVDEGTADENGNLSAELRAVVAAGFDGFDSETRTIRHHSSLVFATLEVCLCLLVRQIPQINASPSTDPKSTPMHYRKCARLPAESYELIRRATDLLTRVPELCTPDGVLIVLPSVLFLLLGILRESSRIGDTDPDTAQTPGHVTMGAAAAIKAIRLILARPPTDHTLDEWSSIVRSTLLSLMILAEQTDSTEPKVDEAVVMIAACVVFTNLPPNFAIGVELFERMRSLVRSCLRSPHFVVEFNALQTANSLFARKELCGPFAKELGPVVFAKIRPFVTPASPEKTELDLPLLSDLTDSQLSIIEETVKAIETVLAVTSGEKQYMFMNLLVRCLVRFLCAKPDEELLTAPKNARKLHEFAYEHLNLLAPQHPDLFGQLIQSYPQLKNRIEAATRVIARREAQQKESAMLAHQKAKAAAEGARDASHQQPSIKLSMDFSAFKAS